MYQILSVTHLGIKAMKTYLVLLGRGLEQAIIRIPSLNNQDSMKSKRVFFVAQMKRITWNQCLSMYAYEYLYVYVNIFFYISMYIYVNIYIYMYLDMTMHNICAIFRCVEFKLQQPADKQRMILLCFVFEVYLGAFGLFASRRSSEIGTDRPLTTMLTNQRVHSKHQPQWIPAICLREELFGRLSFFASVARYVFSDSL